MRIYKIVGIVLSAILLLASCTNSDLEKKKVKIAYANWLEGIAMSHLAKVVLEEHGYEVELQNADLAPIFVSMSGKKSDVFLDAWLPITMKDYMDQYGDSIEHPMRCPPRDDNPFSFVHRFFQRSQHGGTT